MFGASCSLSISFALSLPVFPLYLSFSLSVGTLSGRCFVFLVSSVFALQDLYLDHDPTPAHQAAKAIAKMQTLFGTIPYIYGKGKNAAVRGRGWEREKEREERRLCAFVCVCVRERERDVFY